MAFRLTIFMLVLSGFVSGCFEEKCGPNQELVKGACLCKEGFKQQADLTCKMQDVTTAEPMPTGDAAVEPADDDGGEDVVAASCEEAKSDAETCDKATGLGCPCMLDSDCTTCKASYCVVDDPATEGVTRACLLQGCDKPGNECPDSMQCCDFFLAPEGTVCLPKDVECPFG